MIRQNERLQLVKLHIKNSSKPAVTWTPLGYFPSLDKLRELLVQIVEANPTTAILTLPPVDLGVDKKKICEWILNTQFLNVNNIKDSKAFCLIVLDRELKKAIPFS